MPALNGEFNGAHRTAIVFGESFGLTLKADNLFDELYATSNYYEETWLVGKPRTASISFDFGF